MKNPVTFLRRFLRTQHRSTHGRRCHYAMFAIDIAGYGQRTGHLQGHLRQAIYKIVPEVCDRVGLPWQNCEHSDRGDGMVVLVSSDDDVEKLLNALATSLGEALRQYNDTASNASQIQLRMAVHAGYIQRDAHGVSGPDVNLLFRLLDAPAYKERLTQNPCDLTLIVSDAVYQVAKTFNVINPADYAPITVNFKETDTTAWLRTLTPPRHSGDSSQA